MLTGILAPTGGTVEVSGLVPWEQREQNTMNIGVGFGQRSRPWQALPLRIVFDDLQGRSRWASSSGHRWRPWCGCRRRYSSVARRSCRSRRELRGCRRWSDSA
jgi:hypothetical protein